MKSIDDFASSKLAELDAAHLRRTLVESARGDGLWILRGGRLLLSFSCNDYLNLAHHPAVKASAVEAIALYGGGSGASRLVTGNHPLFDELETRLARMKGTEAACVFGSGYLTNLGVIPTLAGSNALILIDELAHACLFAGAQLSPAKTIVFRHNEVAHARELLAANRANHTDALLLTDGVFSMDGDRAPLNELAVLCSAFDAWLMSDDAHGLGVIGGGRGSVAAAGNPKIPLQMGTLSKTVGGYGGYLCASRPVIDLMKTRARTLVYSTGLPPAMAGAAIAALKIIESEPDLVAKPLAKARAFTKALGLPDAQSSIVPVIVGAPESALAASKRLAEAGFWSPPSGRRRCRLALRGCASPSPPYTATRTSRGLRMLCAPL